MAAIKELNKPSAGSFRQPPISASPSLDHHHAAAAAAAANRASLSRRTCSDLVMSRIPTAQYYFNPFNPCVLAEQYQRDIAAAKWPSNYHSYRYPTTTATNNGNSDMQLDHEYEDNYNYAETKHGNHHYNDINVKPRSWSMRFVDPEVKRKSRLASYKAISVEGKLKSSMRKSFRWIKDKYLDMLHRGS